MSSFLRGLTDVLAAPLALGLLLSAIAVVLWLRHRRVPAAVLWSSAGLAAYVTALPPVGHALLGLLERQYPALGIAGGSALPEVAYVVVLGSGYAPRADVSSVSALDPEGLVRVVEAVRVMRQLPHARLVLSGGAPQGGIPVARGYARVALDLGVDPATIVTLDRARTTAAEAQAIAATLGSARFLLVTSAWHMPRAMRLMQRAHAQAIPLPTAQQPPRLCRSFSGCVLPSSTGLQKSERAIHEYLGLAAIDLHLD